jgi:hypothetical protein
MRNDCRILFGKPKGKIPFEKPWRVWENNIKMDIKEWVWRVRVGLVFPGIRADGGLL